MIFSPRLTGATAYRSDPQAFLSALRRRVETGLLTGRPHPRSRYAVTESEKDRLSFRAANRLTAFNVGLNRVQIILEIPGRLRYSVEYRQWAGYGILLSAGVGAALCATLLAIDLPRYIEAHRAQSLPWLSVSGNVAVTWGMAIFWIAVWPWVLIAFHKGPVRRLLERILTEVDADAVGGG